jgi:hypothetical protein
MVSLELEPPIKTSSMVVSDMTVLEVLKDLTTSFEVVRILS